MIPCYTFLKFLTQRRGKVKRPLGMDSRDHGSHALLACKPLRIPRIKREGTEGKSPNEDQT